jgi:hypothetical protein
MDRAARWQSIFYISLKFLLKKIPK